MKQYRVLSKFIQEDVEEDEWTEEKFYDDIGSVQDDIDYETSIYANDFIFKIQEREINEWRDT